MSSRHCLPNHSTPQSVLFQSSPWPQTKAEGEVVLFPMESQAASEEVRDCSRICEEAGFMMLFSRETTGYDIMTQERSTDRPRKCLFLVSGTLV